jgi:hypothetical protein
MSGGIYLDDYAGNVKVQGNFLKGNDIAVGLHNAYSNTILGNQLVDNRNAFTLDEDEQDQSIMQGNTAKNNVVASNSSLPVVVLKSKFQRASALGAFLNNKYATYRSKEFAVMDNADTTSIFRTLAQWKAAGMDTASPVKANGFGVQYASGAVNLLQNPISVGTPCTVSVLADPNTTSGTQWSGYSSVSGWQADGNTTCMNVTGSGSLLIGATSAAKIITARQEDQNPDDSNNGLVGKRVAHAYIDAPITLEKDQYYWLEFTARLLNKNTVQPAAGEIAFTVQRDGYPWDSVSIPAVLPIGDGTALRAYSRVFKAEESVKGKLNLYAYLGRNVNRLDSRIEISGLKLTKASRIEGPATAQSIFNATSSPTSNTCPLPGSALCTSYTDLSLLTLSTDGKPVFSSGPVTFPVNLDSWQRKVLVPNTTTWSDDDYDGVPNSRDQCPSASTYVLETGC